MFTDIAADGTPSLTPAPLRTGHFEGKAEVSARGFRWRQQAFSLNLPALHWQVESHAEGPQHVVHSQLTVEKLTVGLSDRRLTFADASSATTATFTEQREAGEMELKHLLKVRALEQQPALPYPVQDVEWSFSARRKPSGIIHVPDLQLTNAGTSTLLKVKGRLDLSDNRRRLALRGELEQDLSRLAQPGLLESSGKVAVQFRVASPDLVVFRTLSNLLLQNVNVRMPEAGIAIQALDGNVPMTENVELTEGQVRLLSDIEVNPYSMLRFADQHPLLSRSGFISAGSITTPRLSIAPLAGNPGRPSSRPPALEDERAHAQAVEAAMQELRTGWKELKSQRAVHALAGAIQHEDFLRGRDPSAAERANRHYLIALDLVRNNVRYRAMLLGALGLLHTQVGNFQIALGYLEQRDKLPYVDNAAGLAVSLARARALLHVGREKEAAQAADQALAMVDATPKLARFVTQALDRAALYNLAAGRFERALALYDRELPLLEAGARDAEGLRNRLVARLARCAAEVGAGQPQRALEDLELVDRDLATPAVQATLSWNHATPRHVQRSYRIIASGLRANAETRLGHLEAAARALEQRRALFLEQFAESDRDEDLSAVTLAELRLAENGVDRRDTARAARWLGQAIAHADTLSERTHAPVHAGQLDALWFAAQLHSAGNSQLPIDVPQRLGQAHRALIGQRAPSWRSYLAWFEIYLALGADPPAEVRDALALPAQP